MHLIEYQLLIWLETQKEIFWNFAPTSMTCQETWQISPSLTERPDRQFSVGEFNREIILLLFSRFSREKEFLIYLSVVVIESGQELSRAEQVGNSNDKSRARPPVLRRNEICFQFSNKMPKIVFPIRKIRKDAALIWFWRKERQKVGERENRK